MFLQDFYKNIKIFVNNIILLHITPSPRQIVMDTVSKQIQIKHMKYRCCFISVMCGMSLYSWYNYSLFNPITNDFFTPYYQNCLLMSIVPAGFSQFIKTLLC